MKERIKALVVVYLEGLRGDSLGSFLVRGASSTLAVKLLGTGIAFCVQIFLARLLGAGNYGDYTYALTWMSYLVLLGKLGFDMTALRFASTYYGQKEWSLLRGFLRRSNQIVLAASIFVSLMAAGVIWLLSDRLGEELAVVFWITCLLVPVSTLQLMSESNLRALKYLVVAYTPQALLKPILFASSLLGILVSAEYHHISTPVVMILNLVTALAILLLTQWFLHRVLPRPVQTVQAQYQTKEWVHVTLPLLLISGLNLVLNQTDILMVGIFLDSTQVGIYSAAKRVTTLILFGLTAANAVIAPMISSLYDQGRLDELQKIVTLAARGILAFTIPISLMIFIYGKSVLILFGHAFSDGYSALNILTVGQIINAWAGPVGLLMTMTGHQNEASKVYIGSAVLNILLNVFLIPIWGIQGAAVSTSITTVTWNVLLAYYVWRRLGVRGTAI